MKKYILGGVILTLTLFIVGVLIAYYFGFSGVVIYALGVVTIYFGGAIGFIFYEAKSI